MNKHTLPTINLVALLGTIFLSYYSNTGAMNGNTMGSLSNEYANLFTPAGYAFSIWGFIYVGLIGNAFYQFRNSHKGEVQTQAKWLSLANAANCLWVFLWLYEYTAYSVFAMILILFSLIKLTVNLKIGFKQLSTWEWWPISIYAGWIVVALAANTTAYLSKTDWQFAFTEQTWAISLIIVATGVYTFLIMKRRLPYAGYVGVWAFAAIAYKQWEAVSSVAWIGLIAAVVLFILSIWKDYQVRQANS